MIIARHAMLKYFGSHNQLLECSGLFKMAAKNSVGQLPVMLLIEVISFFMFLASLCLLFCVSQQNIHGSASS